jgi:hypothetical protein
MTENQNLLYIVKSVMVVRYRNKMSCDGNESYCEKRREQPVSLWEKAFMLFICALMVVTNVGAVVSTIWDLSQAR